jgi:uncharacterized protein (TIGR02594 family)
MTKWLDVARSDLGLQAIPGPQSEPRIVAMFALCGHAAIVSDETPSCAAGVGAWLVRAGLHGTGRLDAKSYLNFGEPLDDPRVGAIAVVQSKSGGHHVALVEDWTDSTVDLLGANQGHSKGVSEVNVSRFKRSSIIAYRWPIEMKTAKDLEDGGSRHMAKGKQDIIGGWMTTMTGVGTGAAAINSTTEATNGLMAKMLANPWPFAAMFAMTLLGLWMVLGGHMLRAWRTDDHNSGRKS